MLGRKSIVSNKTPKLYTINVPRIKDDKRGSTFLPVLPHNSTIKDIIFCAPYIPTEEIDVTIYVSNTNIIQMYTKLKTHILNTINYKLKIGGIITFVITSIKITNLVVYYEI